MWISGSEKTEILSPCRSILRATLPSLVSRAVTSLSLYISLTFLAMAQVHAANYHEHLSTVPAYEDFQRSFKEIQQPLPDQPISNLCGELGAVIQKAFGQPVFDRLVNKFAVAIAALPAPTPVPTSVSTLEAVPEALVPVVPTMEEKLAQVMSSMTFKEVATHIAQELTQLGMTADSESVMRSFFEFTPLNLRGNWSYMAIGWDVRIEAQDQLMKTADGVDRLFQSFLDRVPLEDRKIVSITANGYHDFFSEPNASAMARLKVLFAKAGSHLEWMAGLARGQVQGGPEDRFTSNLESFREILATGRVEGIDITGSIVEDTKKYMKFLGDTQSILVKRLRQLMDVLSAPEVAPSQLKIHMYESTAEGDFYPSLMQALEDQLKEKGVKGLPAIFRVGHINALRLLDIHNFKKFREKTGNKMHFVFEANIDSNRHLRDAQIADLATKINRVVEAGMEVRLGTDGAGIFGSECFYCSALARLKLSGLSEAAFKHISSRSSQTLTQLLAKDFVRDPLACRRAVGL